MGYFVETAGRVLLPVQEEDAAFAAARTAMADRQGWFDPDDEQWPVTSLADLAAFVGVAVTRDGHWLVLETDEEGDPKWSEQATAFYRALAGRVRDGSVRLLGEDGSEWTYTYTADGLTQSGTNGWDGATDPNDDPVGDADDDPDDDPAAEAEAEERAPRFAWFWRR